MGKYDFEEGTLVFIAPGQLRGSKPNKESSDPYPKGWGLLFHPDLIKGTQLARKMQGYSFFSYNMSEALHLSEKERDIVLDCFQKILFTGEFRRSISRPATDHRPERQSQGTG